MSKSAALLLGLSIVPAFAVCSKSQGKPPVPTVATDTATFAGGCFWCMEPPFEKLDGVHSVVSGFTGGPEVNPSYKDVANGRTGHTEAVQVTFDPQEISYDDLLQVFWRNIDPTDGGGQFVDRGRQYRPGIFVHNALQKKLAESSREQLAASGRFKKPLVVEITDFQAFYPAESYHQDFYKKDATRYKRYRQGSGRDAFIRSVWGEDAHSSSNKNKPKNKYDKPPDEVLKKKLSALQYQVTQNNGTERAFDNEFWDNTQSGIYVDIVSGEPLFSSENKFKSGTGWPSFTKPLVSDHVIEKIDRSYGIERVEVRSKFADSHLGHLFKDGPAPTGKRYCINSAALRFIPSERLVQEGYAEFVTNKTP